MPREPLDEDQPVGDRPNLPQADPDVPEPDPTPPPAVPGPPEPEVDTGEGEVGERVILC